MAAAVGNVFGSVVGNESADENSDVLYLARDELESVTENESWACDEKKTFFVHQV